MEPSPPPRTYKKTSVLFLGWAEEEDDTEGYDEVRSHDIAPRAETAMANMKAAPRAWRRAGREIRI